MTVPPDSTKGTQDARERVNSTMTVLSTKTPCLDGLRLTAEDLEALRRAGSVQGEYRGKRCVYKLRFRRAEKQVVRYIGSEEKAMQVREELWRLHALDRKTRHLVRITKIALKVLRESKRALEPHLKNCGYRYHGLAIRKSCKRPIRGPESAIARGANPGNVDFSI